MIPQRIEFTPEEDEALDEFWSEMAREMAREAESEPQTMSAPSPNLGVRNSHTPGPIGAIPAKPTAKPTAKPQQQQRPASAAKPKPAPKKSAPKRKK